MKYVMQLGADWLQLPTPALAADPASMASWLSAECSDLVYTEAKDLAGFRDIAASAAQAPRDPDAVTRLLFVPLLRLVPVVLDLLEFEAEGEESETLPSLILVGKNERGPHVYDTVQAEGGRTIYRAVGAMKTADTEVDGSLPLFAMHAMRLGPVDLVTRTWVGDSFDSLAEVIPAVEDLLTTIDVEP
ncbi:Uncharacterised protein [Actinomyces bovis]|uniref:Uncharacterized protein n=1 Tax=Actinomyces bovis TaxID=1658 RepID=A0ABY1VLG4_9ACTO|nr:hypothetical protein [Actinomyces bovis]SPT52949.1 Uncharacterised protein [Actinomyces bovis]VEG55138.1 Uncharacterised protein [Actinomyces israelii]